MYYQNIIIKATGCNTVNAAYIEDIMRNDIFHSTLDWQTLNQLNKAAKQAALILAELQKQGYYINNL